MTIAHEDEGVDHFAAAEDILAYGSVMVDRLKSPEMRGADHFDARQRMKADLPPIWAQAQAHATLAQVVAIEDLIEEVKKK